MPNPPTPTTLAPSFRYMLFGIVFISAIIFFLALHRPPKSELANIRETNDGWWLHQAEPKPKPAPRVMPTPAPRPQLVLQVPPKPAPPALPKQPNELWQRYRRAIETGFTAGGDSNVRQLPQIPGWDTSTPKTNIFANGAYRQP